jgi:hypothetical protein
MVMACEFGVTSAEVVCPWLASGNVAFSRDSDRRAEASSFMITFLVFVRLRSFCGFRTVLSFEIYQHYRCAVFAVISRMPKLAPVVYAGDSRSYPFFLVSVLIALSKPPRARVENRASAATLLAGSCSACRGLAVKDFGCSNGHAELCQRHVSAISQNQPFRLPAPELDVGVAVKALLS